MVEPDVSIKKLISKIKEGTIRIPSFQRGFVWEREMVANFIDSIYKGFPFGSILLWRTRNRLKTEKNLGPYKLPANDPQYPIDYVLDGQQRITSIFGVFQNDLKIDSDEDTTWTNLFFEINSDNIIPFCYLDLKNLEEHDPNKYFPLKYVFDPPMYRKMTRNLEENLAEKIDELVTKFTEARIPIQGFENEEKQNVAIVFERINKQGLDLEIFDLLSVWNWSEDFDLRKKFRELSEEIKKEKFGEVNHNLLLSCCSAVLKNSVDPKVFFNLPSGELRQRFDEVKNGIFIAIDFLKTEFKVFSLKQLPKDNILVVLSSFFASSQKQASPIYDWQHKIIKKWFWRLCFSRRHNKGGTAITNKDLEEIKKLKEGKDNQLAEISVDILEESYFLKNVFRMNSIPTSIFILMLADHEPRNFIQGTKISLDKVLSSGNRNEFHHIFPKAYLKGFEKYDDTEINCLANFCMQSRIDNNKLGGRAPSDYRSEMPEDDERFHQILESNFCFPEMFNDDYDTFLQKRAKLLVKKAKELARLSNYQNI